MTIPSETTLVPPSPSTPGEAAQSVASTAKDEGRAVAETAKSETARLASEARSEARKQGDEQARRVASWAHDIGNQLEGVRRGVAPQGPVADVLADVGSRANQFAERLQSGGIDQVTRDVKQFARQRPGMFLLGTFALGVVAGRTLRNADTHALVEAAKPSDSDANVAGAWDPTSASGRASATSSQVGGPTAASSEPYAR